MKNNKLFNLHIQNLEFNLKKNKFFKINIKYYYIIKILIVNLIIITIVY